MINQEFFLLFFLAHLIGDFVLQTDKIARLKSLSIRGMLIHCTAIAVVQVLILSIFGISGILAGFLCSILHFGIDYLKLRINQYILKFQFGYFLIDQLVHIGTILFLTVFLAPVSSVPMKYMEYVKLPVDVIILTFVSTVAIKLLIRDLNLNSNKHLFFEKKERIIDSCAALILCGIWFIPLILGIISAAACLYAYFKLQKAVYKYEIKTVLTKYVFFSFVGFLISIF